MTKQEFSQMLADNLAYYVANPEGKRCKRPESFCLYHGKTIGKKTKGCFVGSLLPAKTRAELDERYPNGESIERIIAHICDGDVDIELPDYMMENGYLFSKFQNLHDNDNNWSEKGLSEIGKNYLKEILNTYSDTLNKTPFRKFL